MSIPTSHRFTDDDLPVEAGRYRLIASGSCPWCRRVLIARRLLRLTETIPVKNSLVVRAWLFRRISHRSDRRIRLTAHYSSGKAK